MQLIKLPQPDAAPTALGFSPDGRHLTTWDDLGANLVDLGTGAARAVWREATNEHRPRFHGLPAVGFTADGRGLIAVHIEYVDGRDWYAALRLHDVDTLAVVRERPVAAGAAVEIGPGGPWVYFSAFDAKSQKTGVARWNPLTGEALPAFGGAKRNIHALAISADGQRVVVAIHKAVRVLDFRNGKPPRNTSKKLGLSGESIWAQAVTLSADGAYVAVAARRFSGCTIEAHDVESEEWSRVVRPEATATGRFAHFHPSKPLLAYCTGGDEVTFYDCATRSEVQRFAWGVSGLNAVAFGPDGLRCAAAATGTVVVWDVDT